jgi:uncharacterized zinc-type alcohol dehydrogenase-like protein
METMKMINAKGYAARSARSKLEPFQFSRRSLRPNDVQIDILYCGICHSDIHTARGDWDGVVYPHGTAYPCVPGHEIIGRVAACGSDVQRFSVGDCVGVGCMVDSCLRCENCSDGLEPYCLHGATWTYNAPDLVSGGASYGGYSDVIVVQEHFVLKIRHPSDQLAAVAPLLCAGITTWSPLKHYGVSPGMKVGVIGIGGLGHMGIKLARALGAQVVAFTTSEAKRRDAIDLGAHDVVLSTNADEMGRFAATLDLVLDTVAAPHDLNPYLGLLRRDGNLVLLGIPAEPHPSPSVASLVGLRRSLSGSLMGGVKETQEMLDFCAEHRITSDIEEIRIQDINIAFERLLRADVRYRFVINMASLEEVATTSS